MGKLEKEKKDLKKGIAQFTLVGRFKKNDFTFDMEKISDTGWHYNRLNLGVDCGKGNTVYAEMMGGFSETKKNLCYVHGKKLKDDGKTYTDDWSNRFEVDFDDRNNQVVLDTIGNKCFYRVGLEKDVEGKTVTKRFLSQYDAIRYVYENLKDGTIINVKGDLKYSIYNDEVQVKKEIRSIYLSNTEKEEEFKAEFIQTILVDSQTLGTPDKENKIIPITPMVLDYDKAVKGNRPYIINIELPYTEETKENVAKAAKLMFKPSNKNKVDEMEIIGEFVESAQLKSIEEVDIDDDTKELIALGVVDPKDVLKKAVGGTTKQRKMVFLSPNMKNVEVDGKTMTIRAIEKEKYSEEDLIVEMPQEEEEIMNVLENSDDGLGDLFDSM